MYPSSELTKNLERMVAKLDTVKALPNSKAGLYLHLGCGPQILPGWKNVDKYYKAAGVTEGSLDALPFATGSADVIYSSHALEHLPIRKAKAALFEWARVLKPSGRLFLALPNLELQCQVFLDPEVSEEAKEHWFLYTFFGYQTDTSLPWKGDARALNAPDEPGQYHMAGFSELMIHRNLHWAGFGQIESFSYDGWGTPSMWVEATRL